MLHQYTMKDSGERIITDKNFYGFKTKPYLEHAARYEFATKFVSGKKVLDIACGVGYGSKILREGGAIEVYGCDISDEAIEFAKQHYQENSIVFEVMDATELTFPDNYFDCVISFETLEHLDNYEKAINEFHRVLHDDGLLIISTPNKDKTSKGKEKPDNPFHVQEFTMTEFVAIFEKKFSDINLYSQLLRVKISFLRKIFRFLVHSWMKLDFLELYRRTLSEGMYARIGNLVDNTNQQYSPVPYQRDHMPLYFTITCRKKY